ncbi:NAD-dependent epimerase/dehydratase family protein [Streptomyces pactum]|uniref:NAD-dependent epimerase/dehydratase family protein n=1 Tax=Streptomyces pactum TaxID=68249 RepID=A0ABS0NE19_9ACTN|nr:NAD-dependent epimerase/dehydratase family protein [Streptomyces pactum]MBH5333443.1 NAD-dependent epimerase/dehydratase family protein [Streptomyces pactum]
MRVFLAGATGVVGRQLVPLLLAAGHRVTGVSRTPAGVARVRALGADAVRADALDAPGLRRAVAEAAPDVVIHQLTDLAEADGAANGRLRREGTRNLVDAAREAGVRRIVAQSICWAYAPGDGPADESVPLDPTEGQPRARMVAAVRTLEETAAELETAVVLRHGILYGPGTWYAPGGPVAAALAGDPGARFLGSVEATTGVSSFLHVADAARAAVAALDWPGGPVNIVDDEPAPAAVWLPVLARALGAPAPAPGGAGQEWERGATNTLARSRGWRPARPSWRTGFFDQRD